MGRGEEADIIIEPERSSVESPKPRRREKNATEAAHSLMSLDASIRTVLRVMLIVVSVVLGLYLIYMLRTPISWLVIATFIAIAVSGPVGVLSRRMKRGLAIAIVYVALILIPMGLAALLLPPMVNQVSDLVSNLPGYVDEVTDFVNENNTLSQINDEFDITSALQDRVDDLPDHVEDAAVILGDIGVGVVNSIFALVSILILSIFMVGGAGRWRHSFIEHQPAYRRPYIDRTLDRIASAVGGYVGGALLQATIAGVSAYIVLSLLGAPFAAPLALVVAFFDLIPVVGATIAAFLVAVVMLFVNFPAGVIIWILFAIVYQQFENYVIQPQIQKRATAIEAFLILVAVLFGATLFGVFGALLAIPAAAALQITIREFLNYRREMLELVEEAESPGNEPALSG